MSISFECFISWPLPGEDRELADSYEEHCRTLLARICSGKLPCAEELGLEELHHVRPSPL